MPEIKNGGIVITEPQEKEVFPVGIEGKQIKEIADKAIEDSGAANEVPLATQSDAGKIIKVDAEGKYELADESTGTNVVANPELAGTEADLTSLQVGDTKYKVSSGGGGTQLYKHTIAYKDGETDHVLSFIADFDTAYNNFSFTYTIGTGEQEQGKGAILSVDNSTGGLYVEGTAYKLLIGAYHTSLDTFPMYRMGPGGVKMMTITLTIDSETNVPTRSISYGSGVSLTFVSDTVVAL